MKVILDFAIEYYRSMLVPATEGPLSSEVAGRRSVATANRAIERCISAQGDVDRNVTPAALLESWSAELAEICRAS